MAVRRKPVNLRDSTRRTAVEGVESGAVRCLFNEELEPALLEFVAFSPALVGCVAWFTNLDLLNAMAGKPVSLVLQAERALTSGKSGTRARLGLMKLDNGFERRSFHGPVVSSRRRWEQTGVAAVNAVGSTVAKTRGTALMHHKFLVRCDVDGSVLRPTAVWTGSMNFSFNGADKSLENAVIITDPIIAGAYLGEFESTLCLSKPVKWADLIETPKRKTPPRKR